MVRFFVLKRRATRVFSFLFCSFVSMNVFDTVGMTCSGYEGGRSILSHNCVPGSSLHFLAISASLS